MLKYFLILTIFCSAAFQKEIIKGKVISVKDGDTIEILYNNVPLRIRLSGIDCPEKSQAFGNNAKDLTSKLCAGKTVRLITHGTDRYGRVLADVYLSDSTWLNSELVKKGMAWHYKKYSNDETLSKQELTARNAKLGLWADSDPMAPWDFRKLN